MNKSEQFVLHSNTKKFKYEFPKGPTEEVTVIHQTAVNMKLGLAELT